MADYGEAFCAYVECGETFVKQTHNQKYCDPTHKRDIENAARRREAFLPMTGNADGPAWPVVQQAKPTVIKTVTRKKQAKKKGGQEKAIVLPDMQIGFFRDLQDNLCPTHDEVAINIALQAIDEIQPDVIVMLGDNTDFPELSKYRKYPSFARTTQATVDRCGLLMAQLRANAPDARIVWLAGNHESRITNYILDNAMAAFGLRRANAPESWPVLSIPELCNLDQYNIEYISGYPANYVALSKSIRCVHGDIAVRGSTAHRYLERERVSTVFGHVHRREWAERTKATEDGITTIIAASPGCMCRTDGVVPGTLSGYNDDGIPSIRQMDWQQGLALVTYQVGDGPFFYEPIPIYNGIGYWRDREFVGELAD